MRLRVWVGCALLAVMASAIVTSVSAAQFVRVEEAFAPVYKFLDPQSEIITQAKKGDHFELVYAGTSWYQVKVNNQVGWLERRAGEVVDTPRSAPLGAFAVFLVIILGTFIALFAFIQKQRTAEI